MSNHPHNSTSGAPAGSSANCDNLNHAERATARAAQHAASARHLEKIRAVEEVARHPAQDDRQGGTPGHAASQSAAPSDETSSRAPEAPAAATPSTGLRMQAVLTVGGDHGRD